ncbi:ATP-dependent DNA helicase [Ramaria rubella]|nr:ATP-dependent DNA helicase [Ramaria rubella]
MLLTSISSYSFTVLPVLLHQLLSAIMEEVKSEHEDVYTLSQDQLHALCEPYFVTPPPDGQLLRLLQQVFKLKNFRSAQLAAIRAVVSGQNCFVRMPTGSGKSLLWQAERSISISVVVLPTVSLIIDQMNRLCALPGFDPICYYSDLPVYLKNTAMALLGQTDLLPHCLLTTPDQLQSGLFGALKAIHKANRLARFVVDEADKFLDWGQTFRPAYLNLTALQVDFPNVPMLAMSGSVTKSAMEASIQKLGMQQCVQITESLDRPNICYEVRPKPTQSQRIKDIIALTRNGSGIVYCSFVDETTKLAKKLRDQGISAEAYNSETKPADQRMALDSWRRGIIQVMVATTAFGMGIDKSDVRWVVHDTMPSSIEAWLQESGRAGRDGHLAYCIIYFQIQDYLKVKHLLIKPESVRANLNINSELKPLHQVAEILLNPFICRRQQILHHFDEQYPRENCRACDYCKFGSKASWSIQDATVDAINALNLLSQLRRIQQYPDWTDLQLAEIICGTIPRNRHDSLTSVHGFGCQFALASGKKATPSTVREFLVILIYKQVLMEYCVTRTVSRSPKPQNFFYIKAGIKAQEVLDGKYLIEIPFKKEYKVIKEVDTLSGRMVDIIVVD